MKQLKKIKKKLKSKKLYKEYISKFQNKQLRFIFSKVALLYRPSTSWEILLGVELELLKKENSKDMFVKAFLSLKNHELIDTDWKSLGLFMWYIFQLSTYNYDSKKGIENIYSDITHVKINEEKRMYWNIWLNTLDMNDIHYNNKVRKILGLVK